MGKRHLYKKNIFVFFVENKSSDIYWSTLQNFNNEKNKEELI